MINNLFFFINSHIFFSLKSFISQQKRLLDDLLNTNLVITKTGKMAENSTGMYSHKLRDSAAFSENTFLKSLQNDSRLFKTFVEAKLVFACISNTYNRSLMAFVPH